MIGILILIILASLLYSFNFYARRRKKLINFFNSKWGKEITKAYTDTDFENIKTYWKLKSNAQNQQMPTGYIDELTWHDLDMDQVFLKINNTESIIGESYLYDRLHHLSFDQEELSHFEDLVEFMTKNESTRLKIQLILNKFGKGMWNRIPSYLFKINEKTSYYKPLYSVLGLFPILCCLGLFIDFKIGLILVCTAIACNAYIHYQHANAIAYEMDALNAIHLLLKTAHKIGNLTPSDTLQSTCNLLKENYTRLNAITNLEGFLFLSTNTDLGILQEYAGIITLSNYRIHHKFLNLLKQEITALQTIYSTLGMLEASIAVASYRASLPYWSTPHYVSHKSMTVTDIYHPLINDPISNSVQLIKNSIITGSNASGKSTFVKSLAINGILGQTIHTVLATNFTAPFSYYMTSMAISDNIITSESYYIAEIRSLKRILDAIKHYPFCMCFIDEILKGTNTIERIAASSAILKHLSELDCLCITASHDIEITQMLTNCYDNYHFRETIAHSQINFDYKLQTGPSTTRNAIKLLELMAYDQSIIDNANKLASHFSTTQIWLKP